MALVEKKIYSQFGQDGVIASLFEHIGTATEPPFFVEFGFSSATDRTHHSNTANLELHQGWRGVLFDCNHANAAMGLRRELITTDTVVDVFSRHNVPAGLDYVSIDIDSCDLWVMRRIMAAFKPRVVSVEYNCHFTAKQVITFPDACKGPWRHDRIYGASLLALVTAAREFGYVLVHVVKPADAFFVRKELCGQLTPVRKLAAYTGIMYHPPCTDGHEKIMLDYSVMMATGSPTAARKAAEKAHLQLTAR